jgi:hypothetical protein
MNSLIRKGLCEQLICIRAICIKYSLEYQDSKYVKQTPEQMQSESQRWGLLSQHFRASLSVKRYELSSLISVIQSFDPYTHNHFTFLFYIAISVFSVFDFLLIL